MSRNPYAAPDANLNDPPAPQPGSSTRLWNDGARIGSVITGMYVLFVLGCILVRFAVSSDAHTLMFSLTLISTWIAAIGGLLVAWGLWHHYRSARWFGLVGAGVLLLRTIPTFVRKLSQSDLDYATLVGHLAPCLFGVALIGVLLLPSSRRACSR